MDSKTSQLLAKQLFEHNFTSLVIDHGGNKISTADNVYTGSEALLQWFRREIAAVRQHDQSTHDPSIRIAIRKKTNPGEKQENDDLGDFLDVLGVSRHFINNYENGSLITFNPNVYLHTWHLSQSTEPPEPTHKVSMLYSDWYTLYWQYCPRNSSFVVFIDWLLGGPLYKLESLITTLIQGGLPLFHPSLLPMLCLQTEFAYGRTKTSYCVGRIREAQKATGFHDYAGTVSQLQASNDADLATMSLRIGGDADNFALRETNCRTLRDLVSYILKQNDAYARKGGVAHDSAVHACKWIEDRANFYLTEVVSLQNLATLGGSKTKIAMQGVFHLITQRDAQASLQIASDSKTLAEQSSRIAIESRILAEESKRDSTSMNAIAAVTMFFLPGTFVASFLAMPLFSLNEQSGKLVTHQMWVFWAITLPLTLLTIVTWLLWNKVSAERNRVYRAEMRSSLEKKE